MIITSKDIMKLFGISVMAFCAVFVCTLFLNFNMDIKLVKSLITSSETMMFYDAQVAMGKATSAVSGGCLALTSVIMLFFYIRQYIKTHNKELGILKALGYSRISIVKNFWMFGFSVFAGTALGFCSSYLLMPTLYHVMNEDNILPEVPLHFNLILAVYLVILPSLFFGLLSVIYAYCKLKHSSLELLSGRMDITKKKIKKSKRQMPEAPFLKEFKKSNMKSQPALAFFIAFSAFCYSSMIQMTFIMNDISSILFAAIILVIGIILAVITLFLSITTVVNANAKNISIMKVFGYSFRECSDAILHGYRLRAWIGFAVGTVYQYILIKMMLNIYTATEVEIPQFDFNIAGFFITFFSFLFLYEAAMYVYSNRIKNISVKGIMLE